MNPELDAWMYDKYGLALAAVILAIIPQCMVFCCRDMARKVPTNYLLLSAFTFLETFFFMFVASQYEANSVLMAGGATVVMTLAITAYAFTTRTDFTVCSGLFFTMAIGLMLLSIFSMFFTFIAWWHPFVASLFVVFYGLYLIYDT